MGGYCDSSRCSHAWAITQSRMMVRVATPMASGYFLHRKPGEEAHFHDFGLAGIQFCEALQGIVDQEHLHEIIVADDQSLIDRKGGSVTAAFLRAPGSRPIDQNVAHGGCRDAEEMGPVGEVLIGLGHHPQIDLVDQRGGLQGVVGTLALEVAVGKLAQLLVSDRGQPVDRTGLAVAKLFEDACDIPRAVGFRQDERF
jgi:hypothetical protein